MFYYNGVISLNKSQIITIELVRICVLNLVNANMLENNNSCFYFSFSVFHITSWNRGLILLFKISALLYHSTILFNSKSSFKYSSYPPIFSSSISSTILQMLAVSVYLLLLMFTFRIHEPSSNLEIFWNSSANCKFFKKMQKIFETF